MTNQIDNTTKRVQDDPMGALLLAAAVGASGFIEVQEAAGQRQLTVSDVLPTDGLSQNREVLEAWGVIIGEPVAGDPLFTHVTLPAGWKKKATGHSMWSDLIDNKGHKRASMFYKAAFYDRGAQVSLCPRLTYGRDYENNTESCGFAATSDGIRIFTTEVVAYPTRPGNDEGRFALLAYYDAKEKVGQYLWDRAKAFLNEHYPEWQSKTAYWDTDVENGEKPK